MVNGGCGCINPRKHVVELHERQVAGQAEVQVGRDLCRLAPHDELVIGHVEEPRESAVEQDAAIRCRAAVAADAVPVQDRLNDPHIVDHARVAPLGQSQRTGAATHGQRSRPVRLNRVPALVATDAALRFRRHELRAGRHAAQFAPSASHTWKYSSLPAGASK